MSRNLWILIAVVALLGVAWTNLEFSRGKFFCQKCAEKSFLRTTTFFGFQLSAKRRVEPTAISLFLRGRLPPNCTHDWRFADGYWGPCGRMCGGQGSALSWYILAGHAVDSDALAAFISASAADPEFSSRLIDAMRAEDLGAFQSLIKNALFSFPPP